MRLKGQVERAFFFNHGVKMIRFTSNFIMFKIFGVMWFNIADQVLCLFAEEPHIGENLLQVSEIQCCSEINSWTCVKTTKNPADLICRTINPKALLHPDMAERI